MFDDLNIKSDFLETNLSFIYRKITANIYFKILKISYIFLIAFLKYFYHFNKNKVIIDLANKLTDENILYAKLFQSISINCNIFNDKQIEYLVRYLDNVPYKKSDLDMSFINSLTKIGGQNDEHTIILNDKPIKSGTVALVYIGEMNGQKIVIKVMKKNIKERIYDALNVISKIVNILNLLPFFYNFNIKTVFQENYDLMIEQCDFIKELENIQLFEEKNKNIDYIIIPHAYDIFTKENSNILVIDYIEGSIITEIKEADAKKYSILINKFTLKSFLFDGIFHADLHAGNIFFINNNNNNNNNTYKLGIIDFGIIGKLTREQQNTFYLLEQLCYHNVNIKDRDYFEVAYFVFDNLLEAKNPNDLLTTIKANLSKENKNKILYGISIFFADFIRDCKVISIDMIYNVNNILFKNNLMLSRFFCKIQLSLAVTSGMSNYLCKDGSYMDTIAEVIQSLFKEISF